MQLLRVFLTHLDFITIGTDDFKNFSCYLIDDYDLNAFSHRRDPDEAIYAYFHLCLQKLSSLVEFILRPRHCTLLQRPYLFPDRVSRSTGSDVNRQQVLERRMRPSGVWSLQQFGHAFLPRLHWLLHSIPERVVKGFPISTGRSWPTPGHHEIAEVMDRHSYNVISFQPR